MDEALRAELESIREADQAVRRDAMGILAVHGPSSPEFAEIRTRGRELDHRHAVRLLEIVEARGWPGPRLVGESAAQGAFLALQHAALEVQERLLPLVRAAAEAGDFARRDLALLEDRILVLRRRPQVYGSQFSRSADGHLEVFPIEDEEHVDERRAALGLEPLAVYLARVRSEIARERAARGPVGPGPAV